jgi:hypothetical protein
MLVQTDISELQWRKAKFQNEILATDDVEYGITNDPKPV